MANPEQVERLTQDVAGWNAWRQENLGIRPDLRGAVLGCDLRGANLREANLGDAILGGVNLCRADLRGATLGGALLSDVDLREANLSGAFLSDVNLHGVTLSGATLRDVDLSGATLSGVDLSGVTLSGVDLRNTDLRGANLRGVDLGGAILGGTILGGIDLRTTKGLTEIRHDGPSHIDLHIIQLPQDESAHHFLRGVGIPNSWIDFWRAEMMHPIQYHSLFISYSSKDETLAYRLHADLQASGVRCWFAREDLKVGDKFRQRIDEAIHLQDKLLLLLSEHSITSIWVENEVEAALEKEDRQQREVLFPVRLDQTVMQTSRAWAATLRRTRHIGDFTNWMDLQAYQMAFDRLLRDLKQN